MLSNEELELIVYDNICEIIKKNIDDSTELTGETTRDDLWMDSLDDVELLLWVEDEFYTEIIDEDWKKCNTIRDVVNLVLESEPTVKTHDNRKSLKGRKEKRCWWYGM